jgi:hypothetical protein
MKKYAHFVVQDETHFLNALGATIYPLISLSNVKKATETLTMIFKI